jgi:prevent-host-death family protein
MTTVSTRSLKDQLSSYLHRAERGERIVVLRGGKPVAALVALADVQAAEDEETLLTTLEARGLVTRPRSKKTRPFHGPVAPARGKPASEMILEDRR